MLCCLFCQGIEEIGEQELREFEPDDLLGDPDPNVVMKLTKLKVDKIIPSDREVTRVMRGECLDPMCIVSVANLRPISVEVHHLCLCPFSELKNNLAENRRSICDVLALLAVLFTLGGSSGLLSWASLRQTA